MSLYYIVVTIAIVVLGFLCIIECVRSGKRRKEEELKSWISRAVKTSLVFSRSHRTEINTYESYELFRFAKEFLIMQGIASKADFNSSYIGKLEVMIFAEIYNQVG